MAKKKTEAEIRNVIDEMYVSGEKITVRTVRAAVGGGSMSDISPIVKDFLGSKDLEEAPEQVFKLLSGTANRLWSDAKKAAKEAYAEERTKFVSEIAKLERKVEYTETDLAESVQKVAEKNERIDDLKMQLHTAASLRDQVEGKAESMVRGANEDVSKAKVAVASLETEVKSKDATIMMLEKLLAGFQQRDLPLDDTKKK